MTVFVYEDVTATGAGGDSGSPPAPSLLAEGRAMLDAVSADFRATGVEVLTFGGSDFGELAGRADWTLLIAPECGGRLEHLATEVLATGGRLLGPSPEAIRLTADKLTLARHWARHGVPTPATWPLGDEPEDVDVVVKPRDGAGSQATCLRLGVLSPSPPAKPGGEGGMLPAADDWAGEMLAQQFVPGFAASVAFLVGPNNLAPLVPCEQRLSTDGRFQYLGGRLPLSPDLADRAVRIAAAAVGCVPGLLGYVGVDVVLGPDGRDWAIEVNPRLTTSYVGLRALARFNLAAAMLATARGEQLSSMEWAAGAVSFTPDGTVTPQR